MVGSGAEVGGDGEAGGAVKWRAEFMCGSGAMDKKYDDDDANCGYR